MADQQQHPAFIMCNSSPAMSGFFATMYSWTVDAELGGAAGGFYEPWTSGFGRYATLAEAEAEGRQWAAAEGLEFKPADLERGAYSYWLSQQRAVAVKEHRAQHGSDFRTAYKHAREVVLDKWAQGARAPADWPGWAAYRGVVLPEGGVTVSA